MENEHALEALKTGKVKMVSGMMDFFAYDTEYKKVAHWMPIDAGADLWSKQFLSDEEFLSKDLTKYAPVSNY